MNSTVHKSHSSKFQRQQWSFTIAQMVFLLCSVSGCILYTPRILDHVVSVLCACERIWSGQCEQHIRLYGLDKCQPLTSPHDNTPQHATWLRGRRTTRRAEQGREEVIEGGGERKRGQDEEEDRGKTKMDTGRSDGVGAEMSGGMRKRQQCFQNLNLQQFQFLWVKNLYCSLMGGWRWFHWNEKAKKRAERRNTQLELFSTRVVSFISVYDVCAAVHIISKICMYILTLKMDGLELCDLTPWKYMFLKNTLLFYTMHD